MIEKSTPVLTDLDFDGLPLFKKGKVRSVFDFGEHLLLVASDRVSAFDFILPNGIPNKGRVLTEISAFWFNRFGQDIPHHLISTRVSDFPPICQLYAAQLEGRSMLVKKTDLIPVECVVRGYIIGSGWKEYQQTGSVCGIELPKGLRMADRLEQPIFTPAYKAEMGEHDENITKQQMVDLIGADLSDYLEKMSLKIYEEGRRYAETKGIILADTKFEFGKIGDEVVLIDEVLTPDSSRYWPLDLYEPGISPPSYDKQIIRDYLAKTWNQEGPIPQLPEEVITQTSEMYAYLKDRLLNR